MIHADVPGGDIRLIQRDAVDMHPAIDDAQRFARQADDALQPHLAFVLGHEQRDHVAAPEDAAEYDIRGLIINRESHKCALYGRELALTPIEFSILWYLCSRQGRVVPSEELFEAVWKEKYLQNSNNTVMAHIARLREKMNEPPRNPKFIKTVWGVGYEIE